MDTEIRHGISRARLELLIQELDSESGGPIGTARGIIRAAGLDGYTWLVQCLLTESVESVWQAWNMPEVEAK